MVEGSPGLDGHSDADVLAHALADALLGAAALGDLGRHFPDSDSAWTGIRSLELVERVMKMLDAREMEVLNADCTIVCERPRLSGYTDQMAEQLAPLLGVPVSVKARTAPRASERSAASKASRVLR